MVIASYVVSGNRAPSGLVASYRCGFAAERRDEPDFRHAGAAKTAEQVQPSIGRILAPSSCFKHCFNFS
jgi:hypothetical protein